MAIDVTLRGKQWRSLKRRLRVFGPYEMDRMITSSINRTAKKAKTRAVRQLAQRTGKKQKQVRGAVWVEFASINDPVATLEVRRRMTPLRRLNPEQDARGVWFDTPGGRRLLERGFIATMPTGHTGVFVREPQRGGGRLLSFLRGQGVHARRRVRRVEALTGGMAGADLVGRLPIWEPRWDLLNAAMEQHGINELLGRYAQRELYRQITMAINRRLSGRHLVRRGRAGYQIID